MALMKDKSARTKQIQRKIYEDLVKGFHQKALDLYEDAKIATGYRATRYLPKVKKDGGLKAAKSWLIKKGKKDRFTRGFTILVDFGRLDLSLEALVIKEPWRNLFTAQELAVAESRLQRFGYFLKISKKRINVDYPDDISDETSINEGAKKTILVNAYERSLRARRLCIDHYGPACMVCGMEFGRVYGPLAEGFMHVHHLCPQSCIGHEYELDPIADLRPVCPNCHAVIHMKEPPLCIEAVKQLIKKQRREKSTDY